MDKNLMTPVDINKLIEMQARENVSVVPDNKKTMPVSSKKKQTQREAGKVFCKRMKNL